MRRDASLPRPATHRRARRSIAIAAAALGAVLASAGGAGAATVTFPAAADARVQQATPRANFGVSGLLRVDGGRDSDVELYLRFNLKRLRGEVTRAVLRLYATSDTAQGPFVLGAATSWRERRVTWRTRPLREGPATGRAGAVRAGSWLELDVTRLVAGNGPVAFALLTTTRDGLNLASREAPTGQPELVVTTTAPELLAVATTAPRDVAAASVLLTGTVTPNGGETTYRFEYGPTTAYGLATPAASAGGGSSPVAVEARIRGLTPTTSYRYRLVATRGTQTAVTPDATFATSETTIRVAAAGDIACEVGISCLNNARATADVVGQFAPDLVLALGDTQYPDATPEQYAGYDSTWGRFKAITRPAVGNHEYHTPGAAGYFGYFGVAAGDPALGYYSFDAGSWHVVALNSECGIVSCSPDSTQAAWLRADLRANPSPCTLAIVHKPLFASSNAAYGDIRPLWQILYDDGADLVLDGHLHAYERFAPQTAAGVRDDARGIRQITVGTAASRAAPSARRRRTARLASMAATGCSP